MSVLSGGSLEGVHYRVAFRGGGLSLPYRKRSDAYALVATFQAYTAFESKGARPMAVLRVIPKRPTDRC